MEKKSMKLSEIEQKIFNALENPKYKWRTINGVSKETNLDLSKVESAIEYFKNNDMIVVASTPTKDGHFLYTSKNRYIFNKEYRINRWLSVLSDEIK